MEIIDELLRIKRIREDVRERELRAARNALESATQALVDAREGEKTRTDERRQREEVLYANVMSRKVYVREIDDLHVDIGIMKEEAVQDAQAVEQAAQERDVRREGLSAANAAWRLAAQATQKFKDLQHESGLQRAAEAERAADLELEDRPARSGTGLHFSEED